MNFKLTIEKLISLDFSSKYDNLSQTNIILSNLLGGFPLYPWKVDWHIRLVIFHLPTFSLGGYILQYVCGKISVSTGFCDFDE